MAWKHWNWTTYSVVGWLLLTGGMAHAAPTPPPYDQAPQVYDWSKIVRLTSKEIDATQRTVFAISDIQEEVRRPTPPYRSIGVIDHNYILAQLAQALGENQPDTDLLWTECEWRKQRGEVAEVLQVILGLAGDHRVLTPLTAYVRDSSKPQSLRELAISALEHFPEPSTIAALVDALRYDPLFQIKSIEPGSQELARYYPIREEARLTLRRLQSERINLGKDAERALAEARTRVPLPSTRKQ